MQDTSVVTLPVRGMTCGHCAKTAERSVQATPGVLEASMDEKALRQAVARAGYEVA